MPGKAKEQVYNAIVTLCQRHGYPPSVRDLCEHTNLSTGSVTFALDELQAQGRITRQHKKARTIVAVDTLVKD